MRKQRPYDPFDLDPRGDLDPDPYDELNIDPRGELIPPAERRNELSPSVRILELLGIDHAGI